jgi:predicted MFS family arabinose efflux permease
VRAPDPPQTYAHPARLILILSLAPTIGLGIGRFAYALVLPDMRDALAWSYSAAGFMNTINAVGYLAGALVAAQLIKRFGLVRSVRWSTIACVASLALCAITGNFFALSFARLLSGFAAAFGFDGGGGAAAQAIFWSLIGVSAFATPWVWRRVLALDRGGLAMTIILGTNALGAALPIHGHSPLQLAISALVYGVAFFAVVGSTTAFVRLNYPPSEWPAGIAAMTIAFGIGQTLGPIAVGAITDWLGNLSYALNVSAALLVLGAVLAAFLGKLRKT